MSAWKEVRTRVLQQQCGCEMCECDPPEETTIDPKDAE